MVTFVSQYCSIINSTLSYSDHSFLSFVPLFSAPFSFSFLPVLHPSPFVSYILPYPLFTSICLCTILHLSSPFISLYSLPLLSLCSSLLPSHHDQVWEMPDKPIWRSHGYHGPKHLALPILQEELQLLSLQEEGLCICLCVSVFVCQYPCVGVAYQYRLF